MAGFGLGEAWIIGLTTRHAMHRLFMLYSSPVFQPEILSGLGLSCYHVGLHILYSLLGRIPQAAVKSSHTAMNDVD